jgi:tryptophan-rich sensory protein
LLMPYFIWVSFAGYLNYAILVLNPTMFGITF